MFWGSINLRDKTLFFTHVGVAVLLGVFCGKMAFSLCIKYLKIVLTVVFARRSILQNWYHHRWVSK
jgi:hypothetical protein